MMKKVILTLTTILILTNCTDNKQKEEKMTWGTMETEYEGFPLYLRRPDYKDIYKFKDNFSNLLVVTQTLDSVQDNGLPEASYNMTLIDFDEKMSGLFDEDKEGIIFLIETFGGERNYYYFISDKTDYKNKLEILKKQYSVTLDIATKTDKDWEFLNKYPTKLY